MVRFDVTRLCAEFLCEFQESEQLVSRVNFRIEIAQARQPVQPGGGTQIQIILPWAAPAEQAAE